MDTTKQGFFNTIMQTHKREKEYQQEGLTNETRRLH